MQCKLNDFLKPESILKNRETERSIKPPLVLFEIYEDIKNG